MSITPLRMADKFFVIKDIFYFGSIYTRSVERDILGKTMEILSKLFGGKERVKLMRLFLLNPDRTYSLDKVMRVSGFGEREAEKEITDFETSGLLRKRNLREGKNDKMPVEKTSRRTGWILNQNFLYLPQLQSLLVKTAMVRSADLVRRLGSTSGLKAVIISGFFTANADSRVDILMVGDKVKKPSLEKAIHSIEAEIGRELRYAILDATDFQYRLSIGDKLVRDIFDYPHEVILDRLGVKR